MAGNGEHHPLMRRRREYITLTDRLAAALACLLPKEHRDHLHLHRVPAKTVLAVFQIRPCCLEREPRNIVIPTLRPDRYWVAREAAPDDLESVLITWKGRLYRIIDSLQLQRR